MAEVLITLGIIGVVAAITIPNLITNHQKKIAAKRLASAYSVISNAFERAKVDYGDPSSWDKPSGDIISTATQNYVSKYFLTYFSDYTDNGWETYKNYYGNAINTSDIGYGGYFISLNNGTLLTFSFGSAKGEDGVLKPTELGIVVDINNFQGPNKIGRDRFKITLINNEKVAAGDSVTLKYNKNELIENCKAKSLSSCTTLIMIDGWEIRDDYPWKSL